MLNSSRTASSRQALTLVAAVASSACFAMRSPGAAPTGPAGTLVVSNMNDNTATVIDVASSRVIATLSTGEGPHEVAVSHDGRWAMVSNYGVRGKPGSSLTIIDVAGARVARTIPFGDLQRPHGSRFLSGDTLALVTAEGASTIAIIDVRTGALRARLATGGRSPHMIGATADGSRIVTGNIADGTVALLTAGKPDPVRLVPVRRQPEGVALSPDGRFAWAGSNRDSVVLVIDADRGAVIDTLRAFGLPYRIAITPDGETAIVTDPARGEVRAFDAHTRAPRFTLVVPRDSLVPTAEIAGSPSPEGVTTSGDSRWAFVTLQGRNRVITIDLRDGRIVRSAVTGNWSDGIAWSPIRPQS